MGVSMFKTYFSVAVKFVVFLFGFTFVYSCVCLFLCLFILVFFILVFVCSTGLFILTLTSYLS